MTAELPATALGIISLEKESARPLYAQLYTQLRDLILQKRLAGGVRMPSSRALAKDLGVARKTAMAAYDQLTAEGYLITKQGAGTFVSEITFPAIASESKRRFPAGSIRPIATFGETMPLSPSTPDMARFPRTSWAQSAARGQKKITLSAMFDPPNGGYEPLRKALAAHLWAMRGIDASPEQIIVTAGMEESLALIAKELLSPGGTVAVENPGYHAVSDLFREQGQTPIAISVDSHGMDVDSALSQQPPPGVVCVSPTRQYPLGYSLCLERRAALVDWVLNSDAWLVEDDYDSEFRFAGAPLQSMFAMDCSHRTFYLGSLSKVLFPRLRMSFMVAPHCVSNRLIERQNCQGSLASLPGQAALTEFMLSGQFATHLRNMRRIYSRRYDALYTTFCERFDDVLSPIPVTGGFHFAALFKQCTNSQLDDVELASAAESLGLGVRPLSESWSATNCAINGLLVGFAGTPQSETDAALLLLRKLIDERLAKH